ncbi:hypothetical protein EDB84DRAFT_1269482 [Lactarius hengduanensis]|nr:hypothetical protein EDB84DRAFT_1269482 [Lactarius hengduanensis]
MSASTVRDGFTYTGIEPNGGRQAGALVTTERWWRDRYSVISEQGYRLRPRYHPQWVPSWYTGEDFYTAENRQATTFRAEMDATRIRDGFPVVLKKVLPEERPHELSINRLFSSPEHSRERDNHCAPLLDVIELPPRFGSQQLMVFPLLRPFNGPRIQTFGEFAAFFTQICEARLHFTCSSTVLILLQGIRFLHRRNVAHRDCTANNIRVPAAPRPPRYYFIDFGISRQYPSRDVMDEPLPGGDESAPEHQSGRRPCNPFHTDIYYIGNFVRNEFMENCSGFEFMEDLVASMTQDDPTERPLIEDVLQEFSRIRVALSKRKLRSAITSKNAPKGLGIIRQIWQSVRNLRYIVYRQPAISEPDS